MAYNILIVDDSRIIRSAIKKTLGIANIDVGHTFEAENGKEALAVLEAEWVDVVLADINMPIMNGVELVDRMSELGIIDSTPVVIVSTERSKTRIEQLMHKGASAYLSKPFTPENIKEVLAGLLGGEEATD